MILITILSTGKGTWNQVASLLSSRKWDKVIIITDDFGKEHFSSNSDAVKVELISVNFAKSPKDLSDEIFALINGRINDFSIGVNMYSGNGKTHMALFAALIRLGVGIELVYSENNKINILDSGRL